MHLPDPDLGGGSGDGSFTYTTGGITYTMRYLTVTATDDPDYCKATLFDLSQLEEPSISMVDIVEKAVTLVASEIPGLKTLGTVLEFLGLEMEDLTAHDRMSTMAYHAMTAWTRVYTQVYNNASECWSSSSCVEFARSRCKIEGQYYDTANGQICDFPTNIIEETVYSEHYYDNTWKKEHAAYAFRNGITQFDLTGMITYRYDGETIIEHRENF